MDIKLWKSELTQKWNWVISWETEAKKFDLNHQNGNAESYDQALQDIKKTLDWIYSQGLDK